MAVVSLAACSSGGTEDSASYADEGAAPEAPVDAADREAAAGGGAAAGDGAAGAPEGGEGGGDAVAGDPGEAAPGLPAAAPSGRRVVTVDLEVVTEDVVAAAASVRGLAAQESGFVADETSTGGDDPSARLTVRVPQQRTEAVVDALAALGEETSRTSSARDVEATLVDLESRVQTAQAAIDRLRALIADSTDLSDVILLEGELSRREADLEALDAQRGALAGQAALATITVSLTQPSEDRSTDDDDGNPFIDGLSGGWEALKGITSILLIVLGALLPFLLVALVIAAGVVLVLRRFGRRRPPRGGDPAHPTVPASPTVPAPGAAGASAAAPAPGNDS